MLLFECLDGLADNLGTFRFLAPSPELIALHFVDRQYILRVQVEGGFDASSL
jgi:hypothetical protein